MRGSIWLTHGHRDGLESGLFRNLPTRPEPVSGGLDKQTHGVAVLHVIAVWIVHAAFSTTLNATFLDDLCILRQ